MNSKDIIQSILNKEDKFLNKLYLEYRKQFLFWATSDYHISKEDAKDLFQDSMVIFVMKIQNGELTELNSTLKTYIYGIGKQLIKNKTKTKYNREYRQSQYYARSDKYHEIEVEDEQFDMVLAEINSMQNPCKSILHAYYLNSLSLQEIAVSLNYSSGKSVKVQKYRCLKTLKDKIFINKVNK